MADWAGHIHENARSFDVALIFSSPGPRIWPVTELSSLYSTPVLLRWSPVLRIERSLSKQAVEILGNSRANETSLIGSSSKICRRLVGLTVSDSAVKQYKLCPYCWHSRVVPKLCARFFCGLVYSHLPAMAGNGVRLLAVYGARLWKGCRRERCPIGRGRFNDIVQ